MLSCVPKESFGMKVLYPGKFLIKYYEYSFDYPIIITTQFTINAHT
jgi:hypothetical protein